jgi:Fur family transcriptional regulator, ferric uptake regulator
MMELEAYLRKCNIKVTKGRISILQILLSNEDAVSVDYIFEQCKARGLSIDLSTVYRTMEILEGKNIVDKFNLGEGKYNYKLKKEVHKHTLECSLCHKEVEIDCPMVQIEQIIKNRTGFTLMEHDLRIKGICEDCKKQK